jgi:chromosome segregation ATPase
VKEGGNETVQCPCCCRNFEGMDDFRKFKESLDRMKDIETSELLRANRQEVEKSRAVKADYQRWRKVVSETMHDVIDWTRMSTEAKDTELAISDIEAELATYQNDVSTSQSSIAEMQTEEQDLHNLVDSTKRFAEDAGRLSRKKMEIFQKKSDLSVFAGNCADRDLKQVEKDLNKRQAEKDELNNMINELNRKMTILNNKITNLSTKVSHYRWSKIQFLSVSFPHIVIRPCIGYRVRKDLPR